MPTQNKHDKQAFNGRAEFYAKSRPTYPVELYRCLLAYWLANYTANNIPVVLDVGCGTGIATRAILNIGEQAVDELLLKNINAHFTNTQAISVLYKTQLYLGRK